MTLSTAPHSIDRALAALSEAISELLASGKSSRFAEIADLAKTAYRLQQRRPASGVENVHGMADDDDEYGGLNVMPVRRARFNDGADLNREIIMLAQGFLKSYMEIEQNKASKPEPDVRLNVVMEMADLIRLRTTMAKDGEPIPDPINQRIDHLLQRLGETPHEPQPNHVPAISPFDVRRHSPDGAGEQDGDRMGEPVAERANGDLGDREEVQARHDG